MIGVGYKKGVFNRLKKTHTHTHFVPVHCNITLHTYRQTDRLDR